MNLQDRGQSDSGFYEHLHITLPDVTRENDYRGAEMGGTVMSRDQALEPGQTLRPANVPRSS